jgi:endonuclease-8
VVAGIGNIWRCESLFVERRNPWQPASALTDEDLDRLVLTASRLMRAQLGPWRPENGRRWVYGRAGRPCRRCGTRVEARRSGEGARVVYWCPRCQP